MVTLDTLAALDALIWLRTGDRAAEFLNCTQSTVSRVSRRCLSTFGLALSKCEGEWQLQGDPTLINLERHVHQVRRWRLGLGLRLEAQHWCHYWLDAAPEAQWCRGNGNYFEYHRPLALLQQGIIDAWICSSPDVPEVSDLVAIPLVSMPIHPVVKPGHPLLQQGANLCLQDLANYPVLPLPDGAFPLFQRMLQTLNLWSCPQRDALLKQAPWQGKVPLEDLIIGFETPLRLAAGIAEVWQTLPLQLPLTVGDVVMVRREFCGSPALLALQKALCHKAQVLARGQDAVKVQMPRLFIAA